MTWRKRLDFFVCNLQTFADFPNDPSGAQRKKMQSRRTRWRQKKNDERLLAIREDITEWLNAILEADFESASLMKVQYDCRICYD